MAKSRGERAHEDENDFGQDLPETTTAPVGPRLAEPEKPKTLSPYVVMGRIERMIGSLPDDDRRGVLAWLQAKYKLLPPF